MFLWLSQCFCSIFFVLLDTANMSWVLDTCTQVGLFLDANTSCVLHWSCDWTCNWSLGLFLIALRVRMSICLLNVHCGHFSMTVFVWSRYVYMCTVFTNLIALYLLMYVPCVHLVISLMKVLFVCKCFRLQVFTCKCFTTSRLGVSEFCLCSQTHV